MTAKPFQVDDPLEPLFELTAPTPADFAKKPRRDSGPLPAIYPMPKHPAMTPRAMARRRSEARRLFAMHTTHGAGPDGAACRHCVHLIAFRQAAVWFKCDRSSGGDWRKRWPACALFTRKDTP